MFTIKITIYFMGFIVIIGIFANFFSMLNNDADISLKELNSKTIAINCGLIIDSFYSNGGGILKNFNTNCYLKETNIVGVNLNGVEKTSFILNSSTSISQERESLNLKVEVRDHNEK